MSELTKKMNANRIRTLKGLSKTDDYDFLKNHKKTMNIILTNYTNLNTRKTYVSAVMTYVRDNLGDKELLSKYNKVHKEMRDEISKNLSDNVKSDSFIEWEEIIKYRDEELKEKSGDGRKDYLNYLILSLYTYNPPLRADYSKIKIVKKNINTKDNLLICSKRKCEFRIKTYKTAKTNGEITVPVNAKLKSIIDVWISNHTDGNYLLNMSDNQLVKIVQRILKNRFNRGSINVLRKSYLSNVFDNLSNYTNQDLDDITHIMGNSVNVALRSYRKVDK